MESKQKAAEVREDGNKDDDQPGGFVLEDEPILHQGVAAVIGFAVKKGYLEKESNQVGERMPAQLQAMRATNAVRETLNYEYVICRLLK